MVGIKTILSLTRATKALMVFEGRVLVGLDSLVVSSREVGNTADRRLAADGGVVAVMIVGVEPSGKCSSARLL